MLVFVENVGNDVILGLWAFSHDKSLSVREGERQAVRSLLASMLGHTDFEIRHNQSGKPYIERYNISISHTRGYVSVILSERYAVGVDVEYWSERVNRIASRFMRDDERAVGTGGRLVCWCAKEAAYKMFSEDNLTYQQMRVDIGAGGNAVVENLKRNVTVQTHYRVLPDYVLVYCFGEY